MNLCTSIALQNLIAAVKQDETITNPDDKTQCISELCDLLQRRYQIH